MSQWDIFAVELLISEKVDFILVPMIHLLTGLHNALKHTAYVILLTFIVILYMQYMQFVSLTGTASAAK